MTFFPDFNIMFRMQEWGVDEIARSLGISHSDNRQIEILCTIAKTVKRGGTTVDEAVPADVQEAIKSPERILGKYALIKKLGEGGMGEVWKAYDAELSRYVALKFIKSQQADELKFEAKTLASLEHKNIARIYEVGPSYIAMQFVDGKELRTSALDEALKTMLDVCAGIEYAHKRGIIHRDIKPQNIMKDKDGNIFVMDFGLASKGGGGEVAGTPGYMAPEVANGNAATIQSDVYSLGATLYFLLTGVHPIKSSEGEGLETMLAKCRSGIPESIRTIAPTIPAEVAAIVEKAAHIDAGKRYASCVELADDIRRYVSGEAVGAFRNSAAYRAKKFLARNKVAVVAAAFICISAAAGFVAFRESEESEQSKSTAESLKSKLAWEVNEMTELMQKHALKSLKAVLAARKKKEPGAISAVYEENAPDLAELYSKITARNPRLPEPHFIMGRIHRAVLQFEQAAEFQKKALGVDASYGPSLYEMAVLLSMEFSRKYQTAVEQFHASRMMQGAGKAYVEPSRSDVIDSNAELSSMLAQISNLIGKLERSPSPFGSVALESARGILEAYCGDFAKAVPILKGVIARDGELEEAYLALFEAEQTHDTRESAMNDAIGALPGYFPFYVRRAGTRNDRAYSLQNQGKDPLAQCALAEEDFTTAIMLAAGGKSPEHREILLMRGLLHTNRGMYLFETGKDPTDDYMKAEEDFTDAMDPSGFMPWTRRGMVRTNRGLYLDSTGKDAMPEYRKAEEDFSESVKRNPANAESRMMRGALRNNVANRIKNHGGDPLSKFQEAEEDFAESVRLNPKYDDAWIRRGMVMYSVGFYLKTTGKNPLDALQKSEEYYSAGISVNRKNHLAWQGRGDLHITRGLYFKTMGKNPLDEFRQAEEDFETALKINDKDPESWTGRGSARNNRGMYVESVGKDPMEDYRLAETYYSEAIKLNPKSYEALTRRGNLRANVALFLEDSGKDSTDSYRLAEEDFTAAINANPANYDAWIARGQLHSNYGVYLFYSGKDPSEEYRKAEVDLEESIKLNGNSFEAWVARGNLSTNRSVFLMQSKLDPAADLKKAVDCFEQASRINPLSYKVWNGKASALLNLAGNQAANGTSPVEAFAAAEEALKKALELNPTHYGIFMTRAGLFLNRAIYREKRSDLSAALADYEKAASDYRTAGKLNPAAEKERYFNLDQCTKKIEILRQKLGGDY